MIKPKAKKGAGITKPKPKSRDLLSSLFLSLARKTRFLIITAFALWGGGVGCMLCCASNSSSMRSQSSCAVSGHSCCRQTESDTRAAFKKTPFEDKAATHCCMRNEQTFGPVAPIRFANDPALGFITIEPVAARPAYLQPPLTFIHAPPPRKGSNYLLGCALLI